MSGREDICVDLVETLRRMRKGSGYHFDYTVGRFAWPGDAPAYPATEVLDGDEEVDQLNSIIHNRKLSVVIRSRHKVTDQGSTAASWLIADMERAVMVDITRGGKAVNTRIIGTDKVVGWPGPDEVTADVTLEVSYRTTLSDPSDTR